MGAASESKRERSAARPSLILPGSLVVHKKRLGIGNVWLPFIFHSKTARMQTETVLYITSCTDARRCCIPCTMIVHIHYTTYQGDIGA